MTTTPGNVALCGTGPMGFPIAARILDAGIPLTVWNRTSARAAPLVSKGATLAKRPADAATRVVLTALPDLSQVDHLVNAPDGLLAGWAERGVIDPVLVIHGTTSPATTARFARHLAEESRVSVIDAPVSGGTTGAAAGTLSIMVGGDARRAAEIEPLFGTYGRVIRYFGASGSGALAKACNQIVVAATVAAISESLALAERAGLDRGTVIEILEGGLAASEVLRQKKSKWIEDDFDEGGSAVNQLKDLRFVDQAAVEWGLRLPVADATRDLYERMVAGGDGALDHTGVIRTLLSLHIKGEG